MTFTDEWRCCSMHDPSSRRGIWFRDLPDGRLEIRAGREGGDAVAFIPAELARAVGDCLSYGAWMLEDYTTAPALAWLDHWREQIPAEAASELRRVVAAPAEPLTVERTDASQNVR